MDRDELMQIIASLDLSEDNTIQNSLKTGYETVFSEIDSLTETSKNLETENAKLQGQLELLMKQNAELISSIAEPPAEDTPPAEDPPETPKNLDQLLGL